MRVLDEQGGVVCDTVDAPALPNFGGIGSEQTFVQGEAWREGAVLNPMCPGLANAGNYKVILHRRLAHDGMVVKTPGSAVPTSCDAYPVHEGPLAKGYPPGCDAQMASLPWITVETTLHVDDFDATKLRVATDARLRDAKATTAATSAPNGERGRLDVWICDWLSCACPKVTGGDGHPAVELLSSLPSSLPKTFPASCRAAAP